MVNLLDTIDDLRPLVGTDLGVSGWIVVDQARIDAFAVVGEDSQWIHVDPERAKDGPFGTTIAHGYLTLALLAPMWQDILEIINVSAKVNYGLDRVRFVSPVPVNSRIRTRAALDSVEDIVGGVQIKVHAVIEREGSERPVCVVDQIFRFYA